MSNIYFISGPCGVGKSTLADAYAKHLTNAGIRKQVYVIHGDDFHQGFVETVKRALFLKKELEELPENQGHFFDNTGKAIPEEIAELYENMERYLYCTDSAPDDGTEEQGKVQCNEDRAIYYRDDKLTIRSMVPEDAKVYYDTYLSYDWHPQMETYENYYREQQKGERLVFVPEYEGKVVGICTLVLHPTEGPWGGQNIPEIVDLCVFFHIHKSGIGSKLLDIAEAEAAKRSDTVFLAVGCHSGYGAAQRLYVRRGYIPDGSGVWYQNRQLEQYAPCVNDDDLLLFMSKNLR